MKVSAEEKSHTHLKILQSASKLFRARGIQSTSVVDVMNEVGLTHGGFYRHFKNKDELVKSAVTESFNEIVDQLKDSRPKIAPKELISHYSQNYLSKRHINNPQLGCPISTLGQEISRESSDIKDAFSKGVEEIIEQLKNGFTGSENEKNHKAIKQLSILVGAVVISRAVNADIAKKILNACEEFI